MSPRCSSWTPFTSKFRKTFATNRSGWSEYSTTWMSLFMSRFSFAMFSPFFPIALPMSPSFTTKISLSVASTQSTTVVLVRSWKRATYLIVCSSKTISTMRPQALRMFESPGLSTATAATEKGTPQAAPRSTFVPGNRSRRTSPRAATASGGQFDETTTIFALFAFAARRTSRSPKRTSPVSVATRSARETSITGRFPYRDPVSANRLHIPVVCHHVRDEHDVTDIHGEPLFLEGVVGLVHNRVPRGLDAEDLVDLLNRVRGRLRGIDVGQLEDLREVRALGIDHVALASLPDDCPRDPVDPFDLHRSDLFDEALEFLEGRLARFHDEGARPLLHVPHLALHFLDLAELLHLLLDLGPGDAAGPHPVVIRIGEHAHVHEVGLDRGDVLQRRHLDLRGDLAHLLEVRVSRFHEQFHDRS